MGSAPHGSLTVETPGRHKGDTVAEAERRWIELGYATGTLIDIA
jgi:hypothetical protein